MQGDRSRAGLETVTFLRSISLWLNRGHLRSNRTWCEIESNQCRDLVVLLVADAERCVGIELSRVFITATFLPARIAKVLGNGASGE